MSETIDLAEVGEVAIEALKGRFSSWPLHEPAPSASELETAFELAMRAPDHGGASSPSRGRPGRRWPRSWSRQRVRGGTKTPNAIAASSWRRP